MTTTTARGRVRTEPSAKRVRAYVGGHLVVDSAHPVLVWEIPFYPAYYFPVADLRAELVDDGATSHSPSRGEATSYTVIAGEHRRDGAAVRYLDSPIEELHGLVRLDWASMDAWFEEDEEIFVHPRDPYTRVDVLASSRHVRVEIDGVTVADSTHPRMLFESHLPVRYYLPKTDVRMDLCTPTDTASQCPYKGTAEYWSVRVGDVVYDDYVWSYRTPLPESQKVIGLVAFYNEKVDIYVDGRLQERPKTHFS